MGAGLRVAWFGHGQDRRGNGLVTYSREVPRALRDAGAEVLFFYHRHSATTPPPLSFPLRSLRWGNQDLISLPGSHVLVARVLRTVPVDVGHVSFTFSLSMDWQVPRLLHRLGKPAVATLHFPFGHHLSLWTLISWLVYQVYLPILHQYDALIVLGERQRDLLVESGLKAERIHVVPNAVDVCRYAPGPSDFKEAVGARWMAVYCGRLDPEKRVDALLRAFTGLDLPPDHKLVVVGDGMVRRQLMGKHGDNPGVVFTGHLRDEQERIRILRAADCFILPSEVEGLSLALLEAMACGAAPIATDAGGDGEVVQGVGIGVRPSHLEEDLEEAILQLARDPERSRQMGRLARERVVQRHDLHQQTQQLLSLYRQLIQEREG